ncbi:MAG: hypothetical protein AAF734_03135 [Bacteroidota bacterium]
MNKSKICVEAKNNGQITLPTTIFPMQLTEVAWMQLYLQYKNDTDRIGLWKDLKQGYAYFNKTRQLPTISFLRSGWHQVQE